MWTGTWPVTRMPRAWAATSRHQLDLHRVVDLDAVVATLEIGLHAGPRLGRGLGGDRRCQRLVAPAFDESVAEHPRPDRGAGVEARLVVVEAIGIVADVAHRGHPRREVELALALGEVAVHVDHAGQERLAAEIDDLDAGGQRRLRRRAHPGDGAADHDHRVVVQPRAAVDVEHAGVGVDQPGSRRGVRVLARHRRLVLAVALELQRDQRVDRRLAALGDDRPVVVGHPPPRAVLVHPGVERHQVDPAHRVAGDRARPVESVDRRGRPPLDPRLAGRQERHRAAVAQRRCDHQAAPVGEVGHRHEHRGAVDLGVAGLLEVLPARTRAVAGEALVLRREHHVVPDRGQRGDRAVGGQRDHRV